MTNKNRALFFILLFHLARPDPPLYDFWDDSPFDSKRWKYYKRDYGRNLALNITKNVDPDACVKSCLANDNCVSFYYHRRKMECEIMPFIRMNDFVRGAYQFSLPGNRLFRYIPPIPGFSCPMEECFYYDRKAKACWKYISKDGPRRGLYSFREAKNTCAKFGSQLASIDTDDKFNQMVSMLINMRVDGWGNVWLGATKTGGTNQKPVYTWESGKTVSTNTKYWTRRKQATGTRICVAMSPIAGLKPDLKSYYGRLSTYQFEAIKCGTTDTAMGMVCERPVPGQ